MRGRAHIKIDGAIAQPRLNGGVETLELADLGDAVLRLVFSGPHVAGRAGLGLDRLDVRGAVDRLADPDRRTGEGEAAVRDFMAKSSRRHAGLVGARRASRRVNEVSLAELRDIVDHWADAALQLREQDLKLMQRLAGAQARLPRAAA